MEEQVFDQAYILKDHANKAIQLILEGLMIQPNKVTLYSLALQVSIDPIFSIQQLVLNKKAR